MLFSTLAVRIVPSADAPTWRVTLIKMSETTAVQTGLLQKISREFPRLVWSKSQYVTGGWDNHILILDDRIVFRFPRTRRNAPQLRKEIALTRYLRKRLSVSIPNYRYIAAKSAFAGYPKIFGGLPKPSSYRGKRNEGRRKGFTQAFAQFLSELHATNLERASAIGVRKPNLKAYDRKFTRDLKTTLYPRLTKTEVEKIEQHRAQLKEAQSLPRKDVLIHSDLGLGNVLVNESGDLAGILDFGDCQIGDPAKDFPELWFGGKALVDETYRRYTGPKDPGFLDRSRLYFKGQPIGWMLWRLQAEQQGRSHPAPSFAKAYRRFKMLFR